eukprot:2533866-Prymnesium_polylepis.1
MMLNPGSEASPEWARISRARSRGVKRPVAQVATACTSARERRRRATLSAVSSSTRCKGV